MIKKFLVIFGLTFFWSSFCLAIAAPTLISPSNGATDTPLSPTLDWSDVSGADHYELYYKKITDTHWTDRYPSVSQYTVTGLTPDTPYQWYVVSCGNPDCDDAAFSSTYSFTTQALPPPPDDGPPPGPPAEIEPPIAAETLAELFDAIIKFLFYLVMGLAPILIILAAFLILTAGGKAEQVNKGKTIILWTLVAVAITLLAKGLPSVIKGILGG